MSGDDGRDTGDGNGSRLGGHGTFVGMVVSAVLLAGLHVTMQRAGEVTQVSSAQVR